MWWNTLSFACSLNEARRKNTEEAPRTAHGQRSGLHTHDAPPQVVLHTARSGSGCEGPAWEGAGWGHSLMAPTKRTCCPKAVMDSTTLGAAGCDMMLLMVLSSEVVGESDRARVWEEGGRTRGPFDPKQRLDRNRVTPTWNLSKPRRSRKRLEGRLREHLLASTRTTTPPA